MVVAAARFLSRGSRREVRRVAALLRTETVGGLVLVAAAVVAMVWANSAWAGSYLSLRDARLGPAGLHLDLTVGQWAADGLLAIFFFLVGLELKHEFVAGDLRSPGKALVPVAAAAGGVLLPALLYLAVNRGGSGAGGWAIPAATDIAFALAVLAIISSHLPAALRTPPRSTWLRWRWLWSRRRLSGLWCTAGPRSSPVVRGRWPCYCRSGW